MVRAATATAAGMKYGIFTAKHVDGFSLWNTPKSAYNVAGTPWYRDHDDWLLRIRSEDACWSWPHWIDFDDPEWRRCESRRNQIAGGEALYNLGYIASERGEHEEARRSFTSAVASDPAFADAHFNLAMTLEALGDRHAARSHWDTYLAIEPRGDWAEIARRHLSP